MKKLIVAGIAAVVASMAQAATINWSCAGAASADVGSKVYLLTSVADAYSSVDELAASAVDVAEIVKKTTKYQVSAHDAINDNITKTANYFLAIVADDTVHYLDVTASMQPYVYDPAALEPSTGTYSGTLYSAIKNSATTASIGGNPPGPIVPEPTSGLLLLVGMAGLALRRKQK